MRWDLHFERYFLWWDFQLGFELILFHFYFPCQLPWYEVLDSLCYSSSTSRWRTNLGKQIYMAQLLLWIFQHSYVYLIKHNYTENTNTVTIGWHTHIHILSNYMYFTSLQESSLYILKLQSVVCKSYTLNIKCHIAKFPVCNTSLC